MPPTPIWRPPGSQSATAVISLRVRVPVLSLQMTVVEPSVSTADRRRMIAPRSAMRCMPTASAIVIATGRPSGTIETIWLMATISTSDSGSSRHRPSSTTSTNRPSAATTSARPNCSRRSSSGVFGSSARSVRPAMRPTSVWTPVATTTARARPAVTWVPEYTMQWRSARPVASGTAATDFDTGTDSPVSAASATLQLGLFDQAGIGGHRVTRGQQHGVARHQVARLDDELATDTHHPHAQRGQPPQGRHRTFGPTFLDAADQCVDQHHRQDDHRIAVVPQPHGEHRGDEEDVDQRTLELPREGAPQGPGRWFGQGVRAMSRLRALQGLCVETPLWVEPEVAQHLLCRHGMPDRIVVFGLAVGH
jgi:hypothetical protein